MELQQTDFESKHRSETEPWNYSERAPEILRHQWLVQKARNLDPNQLGVLDVGCSFGQLSELLVQAGLNLTSVDVSAFAVQKTIDKLTQIPLQPNQKKPIVKVGSATDLPFTDGSFQVVLFSDGIEGWELNPEQKMQALREARRVLRPGGFLVMTDYLHPKKFKEHFDLVRKGPMAFSETHYFNDRLWFQLNSNLKSLKNHSAIQNFLKNLTVAKFLAAVSSMAGYRGSKHVGIILQ